MPKDDDLLAELRRQGFSLLKDAKDTLESWTGTDAADLLRKGQDRARDLADEVAFQADKAFGRALSEHPDLYAEVRRGVRKLRRTWDKVAEDLGLR